MREIRFRGLTIHGDIVCGNLSIVKEGRCISPGVYISNSAGSPFAYAIRPETASEFTGLRDLNGVEIYEGDIITWHFATEFGRQVRPKTVIEFDSIKSGFIAVGTSKAISFLKDSLVIGNIYKNPELLK